MCAVQRFDLNEVSDLLVASLSNIYKYLVRKEPRNYCYVYMIDRQAVIDNAIITIGNAVCLIIANMEATLRLNIIR